MQVTYPSGRQVQQAMDAIGRLSSVADPTTTYVSGFGYNTAGEATGFNYGNGVTAALGYSSDRLQLTSLSYSNSSGYLFNLSYGYTQNQSGNDGLITNITDNMDSGRSVSYTYDAFYRLASATTAGSTAYPAWGFVWTYDLYGNRTTQSIASGCTGITCPTNSLTVNAATNQITNTGVTYDASGNMTNDGVNTLTYDAAGRVISSSGSAGSGSYTYDGYGHRVQKVAGSTTTVYIFSGGKVLDEYDNGAAVSSPTREYIYSGGKMIAKVSGGATTYYHSDHLSTRLITNSSGAVVEQLGHFAFGEQWYDTGSEKYKFTTYERDAESGNDYAMARYDVNRLGRFSSPDPLSGSVANPQSLNHYTYAGNDPVNAVDPTGMMGDMIEDSCSTPNITDQTCLNDSGVLNGGDINVAGGSICDPFGCNDGGGAAGDGVLGVGPAGVGPTYSDQINMQNLIDCASMMYSVTMTSFTPAQFGQNGSFSGLGPDVSQDNGFGYGSITVNATVGTTQSTNAQCNETSGVWGCTSGTDTSQTYVPVSNGGYVPQSVTTYIQIVELGNQLAQITGQVTNAQASTQDVNSGYTDPPGAALAKCVGYTVNGQN